MQEFFNPEGESNSKLMKGGDAAIDTTGGGLKFLGGPREQILLSPYTPIIRGEYVLEYQNMSVLTFGKEGGEAKVIAYFPKEEKVPLNDYYTTGQSTPEPLPGMININRKKLDTYQSEYTIKVSENTSGKSYTYYVMLWDSSRKSPKYGSISSTATIVIHHNAD